MLINRLKEELDSSCSDDSNLQHMMHMFAGYRAVITNDEEINPYSPGSARAVSYDAGRKLAEEDLKLQHRYTREQIMKEFENRFSDVAPLSYIKREFEKWLKLL
jgi:hypothetical protein